MQQFHVLKTHEFHRLPEPASSFDVWTANGEPLYVGAPLPTLSHDPSRTDTLWLVWRTTKQARTYGVAVSSTG